MDEKTVLAGKALDQPLDVSDSAVSDLTATGFAKKNETEIKARNVEYAAAISENKPNPWGRGYLQMYAFCFVLYLCSTMNGYDGSLMGSINSVSKYQQYYHLPLNGASSTGIIFAIFQVGQMAGAWFVWIADWRGRKLPVFLGCAGVLVGTIVTATAKTRGVFVGGRFLLSFFCTWATTSAPMWVLELAPPQYRATVSGLYNTLWYCGSIIATFAVYGTNIHQADSNLSWRLPLWLQMLCPGIVCIFVWFVPESPSMSQYVLRSYVY
jgi:MFS family permease